MLKLYLVALQVGHDWNRCLKNHMIKVIFYLMQIIAMQPNEMLRMVDLCQTMECNRHLLQNIQILVENGTFE